MFAMIKTAKRSKNQAESSIKTPHHQLLLQTFALFQSLNSLFGVYKIWGKDVITMSLQLCEQLG